MDVPLRDGQVLDVLWFALQFVIGESVLFHDQVLVVNLVII